jgi:putative endonuclease
MRQHYVYITGSFGGVLYVGMTCNMLRRTYQHRTGQSSFTRRYRVGRLLYFEVAPSRAAAFARERRLKGWVRRRKVALIEEHNPFWLDLAAGWFAEVKQDRASSRAVAPSQGSIADPVDPSLRSG